MSTSLPQAPQNSPVFCYLPSTLRSRPLPITQNVSSLPITSLPDPRACAAFPHLYPSVSQLFAQICIPSYRVGNASISSPLAFVDGFANHERDAQC